MSWRSIARLMAAYEPPLMPIPSWRSVSLMDVERATALRNRSGSIRSTMEPRLGAGRPPGGRRGVAVRRRGAKWDVSSSSSATRMRTAEYEPPPGLSPSRWCTSMNVVLAATAARSWSSSHVRGRPIARSWQGGMTARPDPGGAEGRHGRMGPHSADAARSSSPRPAPAEEAIRCTWP